MPWDRGGELEVVDCPDVPVGLPYCQLMKRLVSQRPTRSGQDSGMQDHYRGWGLVTGGAVAAAFAFDPINPIESLRD